MDTLYFTGTHLFVLQMRERKQRNVAYIPYEEILGVFEKPDTPVNIFLEILRNQQPSHYPERYGSVRPVGLSIIQAGIGALRSSHS